MKSNAIDLFDLVRAFYKDMHAQCAALKCTDVQRDLKTIESRLKHEGISFLTITLPSLGTDLESALRTGLIEPSHFRCFKKCGAIPALMRGMFALVFDKCTGKILNEPDSLAVKLIRQLAYMFKKIGIDCTEERTSAALANFVKDEQIFNTPLAPEDVAAFKAVSNMLWINVLGQEIDLFNLTPKHGPGAVAEKYSSNEKYRMLRWYERVEPYFSYFPFGFGSLFNDQKGGSTETTFVGEGDEQPVRVIAVPKTLKKPRIIAIEPCCMQFVQQALKDWLYATLEAAPLTSGHVNFTDQRINKRLAYEGSSDRSIATIDLSSASDRVPRDLALSMFDCNPDLRDAIKACRSTKAQIGEDIVSLSKFASMGSALCFPVEAMYFYTICIVGILKERKLPVTYLTVKNVCEEVYVYGDDIIVPVDVAATVARTLHKYYCKVNVQKSFWSGSFRESCGMDAFNGTDVTPVYIRKMPPRNRQDSSQLISWVETSNLLYYAGYWHLSSLMKKRVEGILGKLPIVSKNVGGLGWESFNGVPYFGEQPSSSRFNKKYQRTEVRTWASCPVYRTDILDGFPALTKCLLKLESPRSEDDPVDELHLKRSARHGAVTLKRRWTPAVNFYSGKLA